MCLLPASCSLEEEISTEVEKKNYLNDASEAQNVLLGIYLTNVRDAMYGYNMSIYFSMGTDISQVEAVQRRISAFCPPMHILLHKPKYNRLGKRSTQVYTGPMTFWKVSLQDKYLFGKR